MMATGFGLLVLFLGMFMLPVAFTVVRWIYLGF
jgi:hypothetical protein